jgi:hypothetical protein
MGLMLLQGDVPFSTTVINSTHNRTPKCCIHGHTVCLSGYKQLRLGCFELRFCLHAARSKMITVSLALMGTWLYCILQTKHMKPSRCCLRSCECGHAWGHCLFCQVCCMNRRHYWPQAYKQQCTGMAIIQKQGFWDYPNCSCKQ